MSFSHQDATDGLDRQEVVDRLDSSAIEATVSVTTSAVVAKVGGSNLVNRKYVFLQALDSNVKWGFSTSCLFDAFKNAAIWIPASENVNVYIKSSGGTQSIVVAEGA